MRALRMCLTVVATGGLAACGGSGDDVGGPPPPIIPDPFANVDRAASAAFSRQGLTGMGVVYYAGGTKRFEKITPRQLLSFTSGLEREHACTLLPGITLAECVDIISGRPLAAAPGTCFDYGSTHLHVAARMAEVVMGESCAISVQLEQELKSLIRSALR